MEDTKSKMKYTLSRVFRRRANSLQLLLPEGNAIYSKKNVQIGTFPEDRLLSD